LEGKRKEQGKGVRGPAVRNWIGKTSPSGSNTFESNRRVSWGTFSGVGAPARIHGPLQAGVGVRKAKVEFREEQKRGGRFQKPEKKVCRALEKCWFLMKGGGGGGFKP